MATNSRGPSSPLTIVAPATVTSGQVILVGTLACVCQTAAASGADVAVELEGVFELPAATSQAWTQNALLYWDDTAKVFTTTAGSNTKQATAAAPKLAASATGLVRLNGVPT